MSVTVETASASLQRDSDLRRRETWLTKARHDVAVQGEAAQVAAVARPSPRSMRPGRGPGRSARPAFQQLRISAPSASRSKTSWSPGVRVALSAPGSAGSRPADRLRVIAEQDRFNVTQSGLTQMYALLSAVADGSDHPATLVFRSPASASSAAPGARGKDGAEGPSLCSR